MVVRGGDPRYVEGEGDAHRYLEVGVLAPFSILAKLPACESVIAL